MQGLVMTSNDGTRQAVLYGANWILYRRVRVTPEGHGIYEPYAATQDDGQAVKWVQEEGA